MTNVWTMKFSGSWQLSNVKYSVIDFNKNLFWKKLSTEERQRERGRRGIKREGYLLQLVSSISTPRVNLRQTWRFEEENPFTQKMFAFWIFSITLCASKSFENASSLHLKTSFRNVCEKSGCIYRHYVIYHYKLWQYLPLERIPSTCEFTRCQSPWSLYS